MSKVHTRTSTLLAVALVLTMTLAACGNDSDGPAPVEPDVAEAAEAEVDEAVEPDGFDEVPTVETLAGMWILERRTDARSTIGVSVFRYDADGTFASSISGFDYENPTIFGLFELNDDTTTFTVQGGSPCVPGSTFRTREGLTAEGRLRRIFTGEDEGGCGPLAAATEWTWTRISPESEAGVSITADVVEDTATPISSPGSLQGVWLLEGTGELFYVSPDREAYQLDDVGRIGAKPNDVGSIELSDDGTTLVLTSGANSRECSEGDLMTWTDARVSNATLSHGLAADEAVFIHGAETRILQAVVSDDACHELAGSTLKWIRLIDP